MAKLESAIRETIVRGARRQIRQVVRPLRREVLRLRGRAAEAEGMLAALRRSALAWERRMDGAPRIPPASEDEAKVARLSPRLVQS